MHRLFSVTEMVAAILTTDRSENALLRSCLQVNRLFSHEAVRILWHRCGAGFPVSHLGRDPTVRDLAKLAARDVSRAQYYANCIHELCFVCSKEDWPWPGGEQWHQSLLNLQFPALESFTAGSYKIYNLGPAGAFNDFLFEWLELSWRIKNSPNLKALHLVLNESYSFEGVEEAIWFIKFTPILSSLSVDHSFDIWPLAVLKSLAALPALRKLQGKNLSAELLKDLPKGFPVLEELATKYTGPFDIIPSLFPHLSVLTLELSEPILEGLGWLADLFFLTSLDLTYAEGSSISGPDLLALAHGCPHLRNVKLPGASELMMEGPCPRGELIDDTTIDIFARALPKIEIFTFGLENRSALTHQAVISLAHHCPELGYFHITASISIPDLIHGLEEVGKEIGAAPLPSVTFMRYYLDEDIQHSYGNIRSLAYQLARLAPQLCEFEITDGSEDDNEFQLQVESVAGPLREDFKPSIDMLSEK